MATEKAPAKSDLDVASRRELALARVLDPARVRAEGRVQAFLNAALELMNGPSGQYFTVQEVIERSGQSLRSFYQYFNGKHELLLALLEDSVRLSEEQLRELVAEEDDTRERLHRFVIEYYQLCQPISKSRGPKKGFAPAFAMFAQQLLLEHPVEASRAFTPLTALLIELLDGAAAAGVIRAEQGHKRIAGVLLQAVMFNTFATIISGDSPKVLRGDPAEDLWQLFFQGLTASL